MKIIGTKDEISTLEHAMKCPGEDIDCYDEKNCISCSMYHYDHNINIEFIYID